MSHVFWFSYSSTGQSKFFFFQYIFYLFRLQTATNTFNPTTSSPSSPSIQEKECQIWRNHFPHLRLLNSFSFQNLKKIIYIHTAKDTRYWLIGIFFNLEGNLSERVRKIFSGFIRVGKQRMFCKLLSRLSCFIFSTISIKIVKACMIFFKIS